MPKTYEYEERAFLEEADFLRVLEKLGSMATSKRSDNKVSFFFVVAGKNLSIAQSPGKAVIKYKEGAVGIGNGFREHEIPIDVQHTDQIIELFGHLLGVQPQVSEQFRMNYILPDGIEIALKYTETWGFHMEIEKTYSSEDEREDAKKKISEAMSSLGIKPLSEEEITAFRKQFDAGGKQRGIYSPDQFREKFGKFF